MDEISNKTLATLLVVAIVISLAGTFFAMRGVSTVTNFVGSPTGAYGTSGTAKVNITETTSITLTNNDVDFGSGSRNSSLLSTSNCNLTTNDTPLTPTCWVTTGYAPKPFVLVNDGTTYATVDVNSSNATAFIGTGGSTAAEYKYVVSDSQEGAYKNLKNATEDACKGTITATAFTAFDQTNQSVCTNLSNVDSEDQLQIDIWVAIPSGVPATQKTATVQFQAIKVQG